jgi:hypothetical protein
LFRTDERDAEENSKSVAPGPFLSEATGKLVESFVLHGRPLLKTHRATVMSRLPGMAVT